MPLWQARLELGRSSRPGPAHDVRTRGSFCGRTGSHHSAGTAAATGQPNRSFIVFQPSVKG